MKERWDEALLVLIIFLVAVEFVFIASSYYYYFKISVCNREKSTLSSLVKFYENVLGGYSGVNYSDAIDIIKRDVPRLDFRYGLYGGREVKIIDCEYWVFYFGKYPQYKYPYSIDCIYSISITKPYTIGNETFYELQGIASVDAEAGKLNRIIFCEVNCESKFFN
ncbi:MAG: hypothetical protein OH319_00100 [Candidatus Parvarchaeota archaeon]|nr:hypothetical protein [Candidatus Jingweiarchaeum tengchongense]MCW1298451.1 hypothetical protein [Candidatus Jingweiarchaeum tengchongense]MCW1300543.1 hypothetical protein [Candidatus Jingweiarchaeum tengchongense]MCW1304982.1 hypothetical protein [Candidatus Jingweiarchaeum tengchongense]MCW1309756.1 hypothetical protein [Candidatus Jingweiarchaeum tengchongense]